MIIKPSMGGRVFSGLAGITLLITGCSMSVLVSVGFIVLCIALPLAAWAFGYAFDAAQTRVDDDGIFQRNFFLMTKKLTWSEIESGKVESSSYNYTDSSGWARHKDLSPFQRLRQEHPYQCQQLGLGELVE